MNDNNDSSDNRWLTVAEAAQEFSVSERTLQRRVNTGKVTSKLEGGRRLVLASSLAESGGIVGGVSQSMAEVLQEENEELKGKVATLEAEQRQLAEEHRQALAELSEGKDELRQQTDKHRQEMAQLAEDLAEAEKRGTLADELSQDKERLQQQLTEKDRQIENLQMQVADTAQRHDIVVMQMSKMLEYERQPFWRRWLKQKALPPPENIIDDVDPDVTQADNQDGTDSARGEQWNRK